MESLEELAQETKTARERFMASYNAFTSYEGDNEIERAKLRMKQQDDCRALNVLENRLETILKMGAANENG